MKIQCDVCDKGHASVFCVADEAAICAACDHRVHHANKLAGKHHRFSLLHPSPKQAPLCDICQERRAFLFCQQDRAILCRECDIPIHKANEHTQSHNRFLLTGIKLSPNSSLYSTSSPSAEATTSSTNSVSNLSDAVPSLNRQESMNKPEVSNIKPAERIKNLKTHTKSNSFSTKIDCNMVGAGQASMNMKDSNVNGQNGEANDGSTSNISEYLVDMLPGWHVDEFLDPSSPFLFSKSGGDDSYMMPSWETDLRSNPSSISPESAGLWVPQAANTTNPAHIQSFSMAAFGGQISFKQPKAMDNSTLKPTTRKWSDDNSFAVPQANLNTPPFSAASNKRFRALR